MDNFNKLTVKKALNLLDKKEISISDIYKDIDLTYERDNKRLNIYLSRDTDALLKARKNGNKFLKGIPIAVKDNFLTPGLTTTASSKVLSGFSPPYESTVTGKIKEAGGVIYGKTNMDAWAHGSSTETSDYGPTLNPRNPAFVPGGSSGGSAAGVASDMCIAAIGSETAGSIRLPAAWCGVVGFKPTYGRVSRYGVVAMGSSLDSPGPMTKTVEDATILFSNMAGADKYDATTSQKPVEDYKKYLYKGVKGLKIGIIYIDHPQLKNTVVAKSVKEAANKFEELGAEVFEIEMSDELTEGKILNPDYAISVYTVVQRSEVSSNLARYDGIRYGQDRTEFKDEAKRRIMLGTFTLSKGYADKYYVKAQQVRSLYIKNFRDLFSKYDLLISTPTPGYALKLGESAGNPMFGELMDLLLEPSSLSGITGISVPSWRDEKTNLYLGLNIMADHFQEHKVLQAAYAFEKNTKWNPWNQIYE